MKFTAQHDQAGDPRWWLWTRNGECVAVSGETFDSLSNAQRAAEHFKAHAKKWDYEVYADVGVKYRWRARAGNGEKIAASIESFATRTTARSAATEVRDHASAASGPA